MKITVWMGKKKYGDYYHSGSYTVSIDHEDFSWDGAADRTDFRKHKDMAKQIEAALLGKQVDGDIDNYSGQTILYKGETISKLHIQEILHRWEGIRFDKTSLLGIVDKLRKQCARRVLKTAIKE